MCDQKPILWGLLCNVVGTDYKVREVFNKRNRSGYLLLENKYSRLNLKLKLL